MELMERIAPEVQVSNLAQVFERSGLASLRDLETNTWRDVFKTLEKEQGMFLDKCQSLFSSNYIWPKDPLHTWSRVWEYPYVYYHMRKSLALHTGTTLPVVVDLGSGATFFPFAIAHLGCKVVCIDNDPSSQATMRSAIGAVPSLPGQVDFTLSDGSTLPLPDGAADILYCVSVLEHIPSFEKTIDEIVRVLKPGGQLLLTFDVDLQGNSQIGPAEHRRLCKYLHEHFDLLQPDATIHPSDLLHSRTGPYPLMLPRRISMLKAFGFGWLAEILFGKLVYGGAQGVHMAVQGMVLATRNRR